MSRRVCLLIGLPVAAFVALCSVASVSVLPPSVRGKSLAFVIATTQLSVLPHDVLGDARPSTDPRQYAEQAIALANQMASPEVRGLIAKAAGFDSRLIAFDGPIPPDLPLAQIEPAGEKRANQIVVESDPYRVTIDGNTVLPDIGITAQAPTSSQAVRLASAAQVGLSSYLTSLESSANTPVAQRLEVHSLAPVVVSGDSSGGLVNVAALTFLVSLALWVGLVFAVTAVVRDVRSVRRPWPAGRASP